LYSSTVFKQKFSTVEAGLSISQEALNEFCNSVHLHQIQRTDNKFHLLLTALKGLALPGGYQVSKLKNSALKTKLQSLSQHNRYDIVHFDTVGLAQYRTEIGDIPSTLGHHNIESHRLARRSKLDGGLFTKAYFALEARRTREFENSISGQFVAHITCSDLDSKRLATHTAHAQIVAIPNSVDVLYFKAEAKKTDSQSIVFVGTMSWYPNADAIKFFLIEVWPKLKKVCPELRFHIVGGGSPKTVVNLASKSADVVLHGFVDDIRPIVEAASIYVCPVRTGGGTRLKILDAFALEKCVVSHRMACEGIEATSGEELVLVESAEEFTRAITELLSRPEEIHRIGLAARNLVTQKYSAEKASLLLSALFESIKKSPA
jgi:polysaccharide biosynthesis protein PslH